MKAGKILPFRRKQETIHPQMGKVLQVLKDSVDGYTRSELDSIVGFDSSGSISRLQGSVSRHRSGNTTTFPILIETHRKRRCFATGKIARVWIDLERSAPL